MLKRILFTESAQKMRIKLGMERWARQTCLDFVENAGTLPRIKFVKGVGCNSVVGAPGMQTNFIREISLPDECLSV